MTGKFPATFQKIPASHGFSGALTVTELLRRLGYRTAHFGKWHIGPDMVAGTYGIDHLTVVANDRKDNRGRDTPINDAFIDYLRANKGKSEPFYANIWYHTVHNPVAPPVKFLNRFKDKLNLADFKNPDFLADIAEYEKAGEDVDLGMRKHIADMSQLDDQIARPLQALEDFGLAENTIVVFTSDNGPHGYGSAGIFRGKKHSLVHASRFHVPRPAHQERQVHAAVVEKSVLAGVDWLPTLCKITGAKIDASKFDGEDVSDIWLGKERPRRKDLFWRTFAPKGQPVMLRGSWKLHMQRKGPPELYDLARDSGERTNVATQNPAVVRDLTAAVSRWSATLPKSYIGADSD